MKKKSVIDNLIGRSKTTKGSWGSLVESSSKKRGVAIEPTLIKQNPKPKTIVKERGYGNGSKYESGNITSTRTGKSVKVTNNRSKAFNTGSGVYDMKGVHSSRTFQTGSKPSLKITTAGSDSKNNGKLSNKAQFTKRIDKTKIITVNGNKGYKVISTLNNSKGVKKSVGFVPLSKVAAKEQSMKNYASKEIKPKAVVKPKPKTGVLMTAELTNTTVPLLPVKPTQLVESKSKNDVVTSKPVEIKKESFGDKVKDAVETAGMKISQKINNVKENIAERRAARKEKRNSKDNKPTLKRGGSKPKMKSGGSVLDPAGNKVSVKRGGKKIVTKFAKSEQPSTGMKKMKEVYDKNNLLKRRVEKTTSGKRIVTKNSGDTRFLEMMKRNPEPSDPQFNSGYKMKKGGSKKKC
jgi:hypothetical protein